MVLVWICLVTAGIFMAFKGAQAEQAVKKYYYLNVFLCASASYDYFALIAP